MGKLTAESFVSDPRVVKAKALLLEALADHSGSIVGVRSADPALKKSYDEMVTEFGELRGGALYYPFIGSGIGNGPLVELADESVKFDFISGIGVHHWGHSHPAVVEAALNAALSDTVMQGNLQQNVQSVDLAKLIVASANAHGAALKHCFFSSSGAMANENALKLIFHQKPKADRVMAFDGCFAGRSLALSNITDRPAYRVGLPATMHVDYAPFFDAYRPVESTKRALDAVNRHLARYPGRHAAMVFELVQGEGGFFPGDREFFTALMTRLKEERVAVWVDEIQTFGRTSELFAFQTFGLDRFVDVVTIGKLAQVCATLFTADFKPTPGLLSQTFTSSTSAIFAAGAIIRGMLDGGHFGPGGKIEAIHRRFENRLEQIRQRHPELLEGPFGIGGMIAFTPFQGDPALVKKFIHALFHAGVICFYCGGEKLRVRFLVPIGAVTFEHIDEVASIVERVLLEIARAVSS